MVVAVRPQITVVGTVERVEPRAKKDGSGEIYKYDVRIITPSEGRTEVEYWNRKGAPALNLPAEGSSVVIIAEISPPNGNFGASLGFERYAEPGDLDLILSASGLASAKA